MPKLNITQTVLHIGLRPLFSYVKDRGEIALEVPYACGENLRLSTSNSLFLESASATAELLI